MLTTLIPILCPSTQRPFSALKFLVAAETEKLVAKKSESFHLWDRKAVWIDFTWISFTQHDTWCFIGTQQRLDKWMNVWKVGTLILFKPRVAIPLSTDSSEMVYFLQKFLCVMDIEISFTYVPQQTASNQFGCCGHCDQVWVLQWSRMNRTETLVRGYEMWWIWLWGMWRATPCKSVDLLIWKDSRKLVV